MGATYAGRYLSQHEQSREINIGPSWDGSVGSRAKRIGDLLAKMKLDELARALGSAFGWEGRVFCRDKPKACRILLRLETW
jgi:hypothetical protein